MECSTFYRPDTHSLATMMIHSHSLVPSPPADCNGGMATKAKKRRRKLMHVLSESCTASTSKCWHSREEDTTMTSPPSCPARSTTSLPLQAQTTPPVWRRRIATAAAAAASATVVSAGSPGFGLLHFALALPSPAVGFAPPLPLITSTPASRRRSRRQALEHKHHLFSGPVGIQRPCSVELAVSDASDGSNGSADSYSGVSSATSLSRPNVITPLSPSMSLANGVGAGADIIKRPSETTLQRLSLNLQSAVSTLLAGGINGDASAEATTVATAVPFHLIEEWSVLIYDSMSNPSRSFHSLDHLWDITSESSTAEPIDAIQTIAAYFHDVVYYQIDGGLSPAQSAKLNGIITIDPNDATLSLSPEIAYNAAMDPYPAMVCDVFGFDILSTQTKLDPFKGMNEFLSAIIAVRCLQSTLSFPHLVAIVACIEATVPFRPNDENGISPSEALYDRLVLARNKYQMQLSGGNADGGLLTDADFVQMVQKAVGLANRDVGNFAGCPSRFLANTWALLPESNICFRHTSGASPTYRISEYSSALSRMAGFFSYLDPSVIFAQFRGYPPNQEYYNMIGRASQNLKIAQTYMKAKILEAAVLAALAELTGGDCPMTLLVGDCTNGDDKPPRIEDYITVMFPTDGSVTVHETVFIILRDGRDGQSAFDMPNSPIATYIYGMIGDAGLDRLSPHITTPMDATNAKTLLGVTCVIKV